VGRGIAAGWFARAPCAPPGAPSRSAPIDTTRDAGRGGGTAARHAIDRRRRAEAAFRGYTQGPIEREYGLAVAILVNGTAFGLLHFSSHPGDVLMMLPYYIAVAAVYGGLTWAADSILPALVLHSVGDIIVLTRWWATGRPEWQLAATPPPLVPEHGVDTGFVATAISFVVLALLTARAYQAVRTLRVRALARMRRAAKRGGGEAAVSLSDAGGAVDI
jgi:hypothetical protein